MKHRRINWIFSDLTRKAMKRYVEWSARLKGQRFYCRALSGESDYNLTINCDLTVSCSCQDYDGSGHIGDLNKNSFKEVYFGPVARHFREELAKGKLPIMTCTRCGDLARVPKSQSRAVTGIGVRPSSGAATIESSSPNQHKSHIAAPEDGRTPPDNHGASVNASTDANGAEPDLDQQIYAGPKPELPHRGLLLENTVRCNIDCIGCDRQSAARIRSTTQMDLDKLSRMADLVHELGLETLYYLNLGEPFLSPNIGKELPLLRQKNPKCHIVISTNGIVLNSDTKREAALSASHIFFSIAGINDAMLKKYEHFGSYEKAYANLKAMVEYRNAQGLSRPLLEWKYLLFNWNDQEQTINEAIQLAKAAGADAISFWPTHNPFYGFSYRYALGRLNHIGVKSWKGREVDLRQAVGQPVGV
jgi:organic radical activating enzyme